VNISATRAVVLGIAASAAAAGLLRPWLGAPVLALATAIVAAATVAILAVRPAGSAWLGVSVLALCPFGLAECVAHRAIEGGRVSRPAPMVTLLPPGAEDWRLAHITADVHREWDPVLWWRPISQAPYNRQGFKGREMEVPKPPRVWRVIAYGDSNTDGPDDGGWVMKLARRAEENLGAGRVEVVNAGVTGYSSHQGLLRFREELSVYTPDVVLVSFGWNDAVSVDTPDAEYPAPGRLRAAVLRRLLRYDAYLLARDRWRESRQAAFTAPYVPRSARVPLPAYLENLRAFSQEVKSHGGHVVFLTRPHRAPRSPRDDDWTLRVSAYNAALLQAAPVWGDAVSDVAGRFDGRVAAFIDECHFTDEAHEEMAAFEQGELERLHLWPRPGPAGGPLDQNRLN
jgi:lysophospholipase L1-like esterase